MGKKFKTILLFCLLFVEYSCTETYSNTGTKSLPESKKLQKDTSQEKIEAENKKNKDDRVLIFNKMAEKYCADSTEKANIKNAKSDILKKLAEDDQIGIILWNVDGDNKQDQVLEKMYKICTDMLDYRFQFNASLYPSGNLDLVPKDVAANVYGLCVEGISNWNNVHVLPKEQLGKIIRNHILSLTDQQIYDSGYTNNLYYLS